MNKINLSLTIALMLSIISTGMLLVEKSGNKSESYAYLNQELGNAKAFTLEVLQNMPAEAYAFKPAEDMRTFAAQAYHIAYSLEWFNAQLNGAPIAWEPGDEDSLDKTALIKYTEDQFDEFLTTIKQTEESGRFTSGILGALRHNSHHRGQMVAYYRAKGMAPPSYR